MHVLKQSGWNKKTLKALSPQAKKKKKSQRINCPLRRIKSKAVFTFALALCSYTHTEMYAYIYSHIHTEMCGNTKSKNIFTWKLIRQAEEKKVNLWLQKRNKRNRNSKHLRNKNEPSNDIDFLVYVNSKSTDSNAEELKSVRSMILIWGK